MAAGKLSWFWLSAMLLLLTVTITSSLIIWSRYRPGLPIEISIPQTQGPAGKISISGAVNSPGVYPFSPEDSIKALLQAAGGSAASANLKELKLYVPRAGEEGAPQQIDINRAEVWLLEALPEIGKTLAQRIVDYRQQNGPFRNIGELTKVAGIGADTYQKIKHLITVAD